MALLRLLTVGVKEQGIHFALNLKVDFKTIRLSQAKAQTLRFFTDEIVINRQPGIENDLIEPVQGCATEAEFLAFGGQGRSRRKSPAAS